MGWKNKKCIVFFLFSSFFFLLNDDMRNNRIILNWCVYVCVESLWLYFLFVFIKILNLIGEIDKH